jgi:hypothetical protein
MRTPIILALVAFTAGFASIWIAYPNMPQIDARPAYGAAYQKCDCGAHHAKYINI